MLNKRSLTVVLLLGLILAAASPALAGPPDRLQGSVVFPACHAFGYDFDLRVDWDIKLQATYEYDSEGNLVLETTHVEGDYIYTNVNNDKYILGHEAETIEADYVNEVVSQTGMVLMLRVPGEGVVLREVGRIIFNPFVGPPEDWILYFEAGSHPTFPDSSQIDAMICDLVAD